MIAQVRGRVVRRTPTTVIVDVGGVGYLVHVATVEAVPARGEIIELHTSLQVREDSMTLYGFADPDALELFDLLLSSTGVGPKLALAALSTHTAGTLRVALARGDLATLTAIPGIGKKVAERLVLELRDRIGFAVPEGVEASVQPASSARDEVRSALAALGYAPGEIEPALAAVRTGGSDDVDGMLREALQVLGRAVVTR